MADEFHPVPAVVLSADVPKAPPAVVPAFPAVPAAVPASCYGEHTLLFSSCFVSLGCGREDLCRMLG